MSTDTRDGTVALNLNLNPTELLALVERYGEATLASSPMLAGSDADWFEKLIVARDLLEQFRRKIDLDNRFVVCPACAQLVTRKSGELEKHRANRGGRRWCNPTDTMERQLDQARLRRARADRACGGR